MIVEDQYGVGDVIDTGEVVGTVENVSLRVTQLRDAGGMTWYVRNGEIVRIGNKTQGWSTAIVDIPVAYDQDVEKAISVIRDVVSVMDDDDAFKETTIEGTGTGVSVTSESTDASGVTTVTNTTHIAGTATDQAGNTYRFNYANHYRIANTGPTDPVLTGIMVDSFSLAGNGPAQLSNGFRAVFTSISPRGESALRS